MADHINLARLSRAAAPHEWRSTSKLKQAGFVFKEDKLLCGAPNAAGTFWAPGAADEAFHARLDGRDRVVERTWTPVTRQEHDRLRQAIEPRTGKAHVLFAWMPLPPQREEVPPPAVSSSDGKVRLAKDGEIDDEDDAIPSAEPAELKQEKQEKQKKQERHKTEKTSKAKPKGKKKDKSEDNDEETGKDEQTESEDA